MNTLKKKVSNDQLFNEYTKILNGVLQLSNRELELFSLLLRSSVNGADITARGLRTSIIESLHITEANFSRYLSTLKKKGLLIKGKEGKWVINDYIKPNIEKGNIELKFVLETDVTTGRVDTGSSSKV